MEPAKTADVAKVISFELVSGATPRYLNNEGQEYEVLSIEFTEGSRYILRRRPVITSSSATKAESGVEVVTGKFTLSGTKYLCQGAFEATIEPKGSDSAVISVNGKTQTAAAQVTATPQTTNSNKTNANRTWKVDNSIVSISGTGISLEMGFKGCDLYEVARYAYENGAKVDPSELSGYSITEIMFTGNNTMAISFAGQPSFYGEYTLNGKNISYRLTVGSNELLQTTANGTLTFPTDGKAILRLNSSLKGYSGSIEFALTEVDQLDGNRSEGINPLEKAVFLTDAKSRGKAYLNSKHPINDIQTKEEVALVVLYPVTRNTAESVTRIQRFRKQECSTF